ncbi:MAG: TRAM domain-containing protein [Phycisphaerae bacterium]|nr:TRAM domain-containing protein [Phycisphaerae bacterium]
MNVDRSRSEGPESQSRSEGTGSAEFASREHTASGGAPASVDAAPAARRAVRFEGSSQRAGRHFMLAVRIVFMVTLVTVTMLIVSSNRNPTDYFWTAVGFAIASAVAGIVVIVADAMTPNKRLASAVGVYIGIAVGLVAAAGFGSLIDMVMSAWELKENEQMRLYMNLAKVVVGFIICYITVAVVLNTKDDFRLVIPYVQFSRQHRGLRPMLVDSSALVDGRLRDLVASGFVDAPLIIPRFVIDELQMLADSGDRAKRERGRRALDLVSELQRMPEGDVAIEEIAAEGVPVDRMLLEVARKEDMRVLTCDTNLQKVGDIQGVTVLNLHRLAGAARPVAVPGDRLTISISRAGENPGQGVGYLPDGTMVVVEDGASRIGQALAVTVTNTLQTQAGRLVFARWDPSMEDGTPSQLPQMSEAATAQPRMLSRPAQRGESSPRGRNPRR